MSLTGTLRGRNENVCYLDFDGVLHPEDVWRVRGRGPYVNSPTGHALFENTHLLENLLAKHQNIHIVLSTSWVKTFSYSKACAYLSQPIRDRIVGATYHREMDAHEFSNMSRGQQVISDVARRKPSRWLAIDDTDEGWPSGMRDHVVITHPILGISDPDVMNELRSKMHAQFGPP